MWLRISSTALLIGCAGSPPASSDVEDSAPAAATVEPTGGDTEPATVPAKVAEDQPAACPEDMVLVDGDYCENLVVECLKKFHAPQNNLWVCLEVKKPTRCEGPKRHLRFCIDRYEFPNKKGLRPMVMQNFYQAQVHCQKRGRRICTESEWTKACEGPDNEPFPYGYVRDPKKCRGDQPYGFPNRSRILERDPGELERLWQGVPSGSQPDCVSDYGVHDMPGNADELAASETYGQGPKKDFDNVTTGGPWYHGVRNQCRPKIYSHDESFAYYYLSWRCCKEADGKPTDPRSPKQIKRGDSWDKIVHRANHSWKLPFNPHVPGDAEYSPAGPDRKPR